MTRLLLVAALIAALLQSLEVASADVPSYRQNTSSDFQPQVSLVQIGGKGNHHSLSRDLARAATPITGALAPPLRFRTTHFVGGKSTPTTWAAPTKPLKLVVIGDSLRERDCATCATVGELFGRALARAANRQVEVRDFTKHAAIDTRDLRRELDSNSALRAQVATAGAITIMIGHHESLGDRRSSPCGGPCLRDLVPSYAHDLRAILRTVRKLRAGKPTLLRITDDYDDMIGRPGVSVSPWALKQFFDTYSAIARQLAWANGGICIDTYHAFNGPTGTRDAGDLLEPDHIHPNDAGQELIAQLLERAGYRPLVG